MPRRRPTGSLFDPAESALVAAVARLAFANPFLPERVEAERAALGEGFVDRGAVWSREGAAAAPSENLRRIRERLVPVLDGARDCLAGGAAATAGERDLYRDACLFYLFDRYDERLQPFVEGSTARVGFYKELARDHERLLCFPGSALEAPEPAHLFACIFQLRRAFHHIFSNLLGASLPAARLRAAAWQSVFTHDMRRYQRALFSRMADVHTLVTGPTGTGKELVARAIGLSRYVPFDVGAQRFAGVPAEGLRSINLSALSPSLIESELFGHKRGAFTGAVEDRRGWLEVDEPSGTVFLDEIGELEGSIQVKLLRVLQTRSFERLGEARPRAFAGRIVAATHRDLAERIRAGLFRADLYYRLCGDLIATPSLREQLDDAPGDRARFLRFIAAKVASPAEAEGLAAEVDAWIDGNLPPDYPWPGNVRELEQCVRNVMVRRAYPRPEAPGVPAAPGEGAVDLAREYLEGTLSMDEVVGRYTTLVFARTGSYAKAAQQLGVNWKTVAAKVDQDLLAKLGGRLS